MSTGFILQGQALRVHAAPAEVHHRRDAIREQLDRLLASSLFKHSNHYRVLLRYLVEQALDGNAGPYKERVLGVEVFGRDPLYDTNLDPVVRTSACEVRKRIAQYYLEPGREREIRIDIKSRSYIAEFHFPEAPVITMPAPAVPVEPVPVESVAAPARRWPRYAWTTAALCTVLVGVGAASLRGGRGPVNQFWASVWSQSDPVIVCVSAPDPVVDPFRGVAYTDALAMARLTGLLGAHGQRFEVRRNGSLSLADLKKGPSILIGAFNNEWTLSLENQLRFTFEHDDATKQSWIRDRQNPSQRSWVRDPAVPRLKRTADYAIVSRFLDSRTERMVVVVAGMGGNGTEAASEFATEPRYLEALAANAPSGRERRNVQAVIGTELVNGHPGPPRILATHFW